MQVEVEITRIRKRRDKYGRPCTCTTDRAIRSLFRISEMTGTAVFVVFLFFIGLMTEVIEALSQWSWPWPTNIPHFIQCKPITLLFHTATKTKRAQNLLLRALPSFHLLICLVLQRHSSYLDYVRWKQWETRFRPSSCQCFLFFETLQSTTLESPALYVTSFGNLLIVTMNRIIC